MASAFGFDYVAIPELERQALEYQGFYKAKGEPSGIPTTSQSTLKKKKNGARVLSAKELAAGTLDGKSEAISQKNFRRFAPKPTRPKTSDLKRILIEAIVHLRDYLLMIFCCVRYVAHSPTILHSIDLHIREESRRHIAHWKKKLTG